jgi:DNA-binding beta-propeller fold protein YncE
MNRLTQILLIAFALVSTTALAEELKFSITPNFFEQDPGGKSLGPCHGGVVIDKAGNIYISTDTERGILVFNPEGKFVRSFGPTRIHGMELREEEGVYYIYGARPSDHDVVKIKLDGTTMWTIHYPKESGIYKDQDGFKPCAVTAGPDGSIYVADGYGSNFGLKFDRDQKFVKSFGGPGSEEGKFDTCHGIALDRRQDKPMLFICNRKNHRVEYWDLDGNFVKIIRNDLRLPSAISFRGDYAVIADLAGRVTILNKAGDIVAQVGDNPNESQRANYDVPPDQFKPGICNAPHGAALDYQGNLIVTEWNKYGHLHKFTRD